MSTTSTEKKTLPDLYKMVFDRITSVKNEYATTFSKIFPTETKPEYMIDPIGTKRELNLSDYVELYKKAFEKHPPYAINDGDYHLRTEATATPGTINRICYNEEEDRYYGLFNHSTIMKSEDLETWEDAMKLSVDEEYAFMNAEIDFFLYNLAQTYYAEAKELKWSSENLDQYTPELIGPLKSTRIKEFTYMNGVYLIVVENCIGIQYPAASVLPPHPESASDTLMQRAFANKVDTGRKDSYYEIVYATEILEDPRRWTVVTSGPKSEWEGLVANDRYSAGNGSDGVGNIADRPHVREYTDFDTDWRNTWVILMTNGDYFVSHDHFHSFTEQHVDNLVVQRGPIKDLHGYANNRYPRMFNSISHYQYYDVDELKVSSEDLRIVTLGTDGHPKLEKPKGSNINLDSNSSPNNNVWVIGGLESELMLTHDLSTWVELPRMMKAIVENRNTTYGHIAPTITHLLKMGRGCTLSRFSFALTTVEVEPIPHDSPGSQYSCWFGLSRRIPRRDLTINHSLEIDGGALTGESKVPVIQRAVITLEAWIWGESFDPVDTWNEVLHTGQFSIEKSVWNDDSVINRNCNATGLYAIHNPNADDYRPYWDIAGHHWYSMDYVIGCGIVPNLSGDSNSDNPYHVLRRYPESVFGPDGRTRSDSTPKRYQVKLPGDTQFTTIENTYNNFGIAEITSVGNYGYWDYGYKCGCVWNATVCFSRSRHGCIVAYRDTIREYSQAPDTGIMQLLNSVKIIPNMVTPNRLAGMCQFDMRDEKTPQRAPANDTDDKVPDLVGNSYMSAPYTVKYCPEAGMYFAWERYNTEASINRQTYAKEYEVDAGGYALGGQRVTIRFLESYDGIHWKKQQSPPFSPFRLPAPLPGSPNKIDVGAFDPLSGLGSVPADAFSFWENDWAIKNIYTFRTNRGQLMTLVLIVSGFYLLLDKSRTGFDHVYMSIFPIDSVIANNLYYRYVADANDPINLAKRKINDFYGYQADVFPLETYLGDRYGKNILVVRSLSMASGQNTFTYTYRGQPITYRTVSYIDLETNEDMAANEKYTMLNLPANMMKEDATRHNLGTFFKFPMYQQYLCSKRTGNPGEKFILHRYNEVYRTAPKTNDNNGGLFLQAALNQADNVSFKSLDDTTLKAAKGGYIGPQMYQNSSETVRTDLAMYENASPGYIVSEFGGVTETEGSSTMYMLNILGHHNYNPFMLISPMTTNHATPVPVMSYRAKGLGRALIGITDEESYTQKKPFVRDFGSQVWGFFDRGVDGDHIAAIGSPFQNAVQMSTGSHDGSGIVTNKGHYYVNFMETDTDATDANRGIWALPAAVDLSMLPYDYRKRQFDGAMNNFSIPHQYSLRPTRILTYDGMTIFNYQDRLLYRTYGKMEVAHDVLLQAYNDKTEGIYGRALNIVGNPFIEGSILQKENNKLFLTSPTGQLSLVEIERPADVDDIGSTKCLIDPDTMMVQYGTRRELETKEEWRPLYNADIHHPYASNSIWSTRPAVPVTTPYAQVIKDNIGLSGGDSWKGPIVTTWKDFIFIVDQGNLRVLSKQWQDGWTDDYPVIVSLDTNGDGTGTKIWILGVALLDWNDTVDVHASAEKGATPSNITPAGIVNGKRGTVRLHLFTNTGIYGMDINPSIIRNTNLTEAPSDPRRVVTPLDNVLQRVFQKIVSGKAVGTPFGEWSKVDMPFLDPTWEAQTCRIYQVSSLQYVMCHSYKESTNITTRFTMWTPPLAINTGLRNQLDDSFSLPATDKTDRTTILHSGPLTMRYSGRTGAEVSFNLALGNTQYIDFTLDIGGFISDGRSGGIVLGAYDATSFNIFRMVSNIAYNPDNGEIIFLVKTVGASTEGNNKAVRNLGMMKYQLEPESCIPAGDAYYARDNCIDTSYPLKYLGSAHCDHIEMVDMEYYNHQWIAVGYKAPYTNDKWGSNIKAANKFNNAHNDKGGYWENQNGTVVFVHVRNAQSLLHACYSKDGLNWGEYYNLEVAKPLDDPKLSKFDRPYLIVDNERGNCLIYDGAGRILAKTISKKYALENQVVLGEQTNVYARAVYRGYPIGSNANFTSGCDIVIGAIYPEYMFGDSFDLVQLAGTPIELVTPKINSTDAVVYGSSQHVMDFHSIALAAFDSFNLGTNDWYDDHYITYPYDIDYNANGRSGGLYAQFYHSLTLSLGATNTLATTDVFPLSAISRKAIAFYRSNNPDNSNYDYPLWALWGYQDTFPTTRYAADIPTKPNASDAICDMSVYPIKTGRTPFKLYDGPNSRVLDVSLAETATNNGRFVDYDYPIGQYLYNGDPMEKRWKRRSNARFEYSPIALTQNLTTKNAYITLYEGGYSTVLYFPSAAKVWIHLNLLKEFPAHGDTSHPAQYVRNQNAVQQFGIPYVDSGSYTYTYLTIIGRKLETLHTYDQQVNIDPAKSSPYVIRYNGAER